MITAPDSAAAKRSPIESAVRTLATLRCDAFPDSLPSPAAAGLEPPKQRAEIYMDDGASYGLDFGEEADDKGFYVVDIEPGEAEGRRQVSFHFEPVRGRRFLTISLDLEDADSTAAVVGEITGQAESIKDAIVRLQLSLPAEVEGQLNDADIRAALKEAHYFTVAKDIKRETRLRLGKWAAEEITPVEALKAYLESKKVSSRRTKTLLEYGDRLIHGETGSQEEKDV